MTGLLSTVSHIFPIVFIFIISALGVFFIRRQLLKHFTDEKTQKIITKAYKAILGGMIAAVALIVFIVLVFLSNPLERANIKTNTAAMVDNSYIDKTREEINKTNKEVVERKHIEKETEATNDNERAFAESKELFK